MGNLWLTSDTHLGHPFVARLRGYETAEEHDSAFRSMWLRRVAEDDDVWLLGDVALGGWRDRLPLFRRLPGRKHLVLGNHDRAHPLHRNGHKYLGVYGEVFDSVQTAAAISLGDGSRVMLSHFPYEGDHGPDRFTEWRLRDAGRVLLHGHTHGPERGTMTRAGTPQVHVGLDAWGQALVHRTDVLDVLKTL